MKKGLPELPEGSILKEIYEYARERTKAPEEIVFWTVFALLGACLKNDVYIDWAVKTVFPNFPLLIVAPSGWGKTGAVNSTMDIFEGFLPYSISEDSTAESFIKEFSEKGTKLENPVCTSSLWVVPELADIFGKKKYQEGLIARLTRILDAPKNRKVSRMNADPLLIKGYALFNWISCTTYTWLEQSVEESAGTGGFLPRVFVVNTEEPPRMNTNPQKDRALEQQLKTKLAETIRAVKIGPMPITPEIQAYLEQNYNDHMAVIGTDMENIIARRDENFLRIFIILKAYSGITQMDELLRISYASCKSLETNNLNLFISLKNNKKRNNYDYPLHNSVLKKMRKCVNQTIPYAKFLRDLHCTTHELKPVLTHFKDNGYIKWDGSTGDTGNISISAAILDLE